MAPRQTALLLTLAAIWGGSYLLIKYALEDLSVPMIVFGRTALAALVLALALRFSAGPGALGAALADVRARPGWALALGLISVTLPFLFITLGELEVPSGLTAVLISPTSLFVALLAPFIDTSERIGRRQAIGLGLGLGGVALVVGVESIHSLAAFLGALSIVSATFFYALGTFVVKGRYGRLTSLQTSFVSISVASVVTLPAAIATAPSQAPGLGAIAAVATLGVVGTAIAFVIFYTLIAQVGAGRASLVSYLAPGVALLYGALLLDEEVTVAAIAGLVAILAGVWLASRPREAPVLDGAEAPEPAVATPAGR